jgi:hypothetical protein
MKDLPDGLIAVVKHECQTCSMIQPVLATLAGGHLPLTVFTQDDPDFPSGLKAVIDDTGLEYSYHLDIEVVPTLIRVENGREMERIIGWDREEWQQFTGIADLGQDLPAQRPGCGARNVEPAIAEELALRYQRATLKSRKIELASQEDDLEACFERGWTDGLPVVPPTEKRVKRMLQGTRRAPDEVVGVIPPNQASCTVEKAAVNAVMAGCKPEYLPVVLAAVEAACMDAFCMHGLLATTYFSGPVVIVNGPITRAIGMNAGINVFGQGNRANATIGRALQLIIRNVGGGRPGGVDRATFGNPGKYTFCFAENEDSSPWEPLSVERGFKEGISTVTLFAGDGVQAIMDQLSRTPESLARTYAGALKAVAHPKIFMVADAMLVVSPEHARTFREAGWIKQRLRREIDEVLQTPGRELIRGAQDIAEGMPEMFAEADLTKFGPGGLHIVHAGGRAGMFSAIIGGWVASGPIGSQSVTKEITL